MVRLTFLGTGGGRFATIYQARATGGIYIEDEKNLPIDPGPGALVRMRSVGLDPLRTHAILISHCHPDHYIDAEILIEAMTEGGTRKQGVLIGSRSVIEGDGEFGPAISNYHLSKPKVVKSVSPFSKISLKPIEISTTPSAHSDTSSVGFRIQTPAGSGVIQENPETQAKWIEDRSGVKTVAARDFMVLDFDKDGITVADRIRQ